MAIEKSLSSYCSQIKTQNKKALVTYITAGIKNWQEAIAICFENGADIVEVGLPFSDPTMDGPIIAKASYKSIENGSRTLELLESLEKQVFDKPLVVMTYANVLYAQKLSKSIEALKKANIKGLIIPDLTFEESHVLDNEIASSDIAHIQLVSSTTSEKRSDLIVKQSEGFVYTVALKGLTGQEVKFDDDTIAFFNKIKSESTQPSYCGIGIKNAEQAKHISEYCDGVIVGSSIVDLLMNDPDNLDAIAKFVKGLRLAIDES